ncbi:hypothetical protein GCM10010214_51580 [Streptomyces abikoensis]|uniref:DUF3566 domain-containing protein n=2 Tax=Streptomyces abikoensis TaxID=97398 RepID=UPI0019B69E46|nr:hypothetical protein GCM10010214_51580 [Streptomyces abikoensis]
MSRATGTAKSGAGAERQEAAPPVPSDTEARGSAADGTAGEDGAADKAGTAGKDGAGSRAGGTRTAVKGETMTETRGPQPYHPPKAYEPPAERSDSDSASEPAAEAAKASGGSAKGARNGKGAKDGKPSRSAQAGPAAKSGPAGQAAKAGKDAKAAKVPGPARSPEGAAGQDPASAQRPAARTAPTGPRTRKARLRVAKADPWSVMKVSFLLSVALGVCTIVAAAVLWSVMDAMGVFQAVGGTVSDATASGEGGGFDLESFLSLPHVLLFTTVIAVVDVVLATALATLAAFVYNLAAGFVGGVELTLAEDE